MRRTMTVGLFVAGVLAVASFSDAQPPGGAGGGQPPGKGDKGDKGGKGGFGEKGGKGGPGGGMGGMMAQPGQLMAISIQEMLKLTDGQKKDLDALQKDVDTKLDKLLTDDQKKQLKEMKDRGGRGGPGGPGGPGGGFGEKGGKGGPGGPGGGGEPPAKKP